MNYQNRLFLSTLYILIPLLGFAQSLSNRIYVASASSAGPTANGKSWKTAFTELQTALQVAKSGDTIWIAEGTYLPTKTTNRDISFIIPNGVKLYGGFNGSEESIQDRTPNISLSVLSGKLTESTRSKHIMTLTDADSTTVIDGLIIEGGSFLPDLSGTGAGGGVGAGIWITSSTNKNCNPTISNCIIRNNEASSGGGIHITIKGLTGKASIKIISCTFINNFASNGGGIYMTSSNPEMGLNIENCYFSQNTATVFASALQYTGVGSMYVKNSHFLKNENLGTGGIVWINLSGNLTVEKCSFTEETQLGGTIFTTTGGVSTSSKHEVKIIGSTFSQIRGLDKACIYFDNYEKSTTNLLIQDCTFGHSLNNKESNAIKILSSGDSLKLNFTIDRCIFLNNKALSTNQGVLHLYNNSKINDRVSGLISNCIFYKNERGISYHQNGQGISRIQVINSSFIKNLQPDITTNLLMMENRPQVIIVNSIFYKNNVSLLTSIIQNINRGDLSGFHFNHNLFSVPSCKSTTDTLGCGIGNIFGQYPKFVDSSSIIGLKLAPGSIAINAGRWHPELPALDLSGQPRVQDCKVDLGAYESPSILPTKDSLSAKAQIRSTSINQSLGEIGIQQISGGFPPYRLLWENGDTVRTRRNLAAGTYTLTLSDLQGCFKNYRFVVPFTTGVRDRVAQGAISLAPNPVPTGQSIKLFYQDIEPGNWELQLLDLTGKQLRNSRMNLPSQGEMPIQLDALPKGVYLLKVSKDRQVFNHKFVIL